MLLTDEKTSHLSHVILGALKKVPGVRVLSEEQALRDIKRVLAVELAAAEAVDQRVRSRLASYSRPVIEGSAEWDVLYRKFAEEELRRHAIS